MRAVYAYYRVRAADAPALLQGFEALRRAMAAAPGGLRLSLLRRDDPDRPDTGDPDALHTWMEIHERPGDGLDAATSAAVEAAAQQHLGALIEGQRHLEWFRPVA